MFEKLLNFLNMDLFGGKQQPAISNETDMVAMMRAAQAKNIDAEKALSCSAVYACVGIISKAIASFPLVIYKRTNKGRTLATDHKLYKIFKDEPNDFQCPIDFIQWLVTTMLLNGKACAYISRIGQKVMSLTPIAPTAITEVWDDDKHYFEADVNGKNLTLQPKDVFCVKAMTLDGKNAVNPLQFFAASIGLNLESVDYNNDFLRMAVDLQEL